VQICPGCGEENPARFRLCGYCGTPLAAPASGQEIRKTVTIVFSDLKGSTDLGERLDSESLREVMTSYFEAMRAELEGHGGTIEKYIGDAIMAVFGLPTLHEDDALRAVRAAAGMQQALAALNDELDRMWGVRLANRTGVNTGEVVAGDPAGGQRLVTGDPVNTAARLEQAAPPNEVLIGDLTYRLVRDLVDVEPVEPLELKGKAEPVTAYRLRSVAIGRPAHGADAAPMIGRAAEMGRLREVFGDAVGSRRLRTVTIVGDAGVGKSRLTREFLASVDEEAYIVRGRCLPYGRGITFWPIVEIVRAVADIDDDDPPDRARSRLLGLVGDTEVAARIASVIGLSEAAFALGEVFWAVRRLVEILAERGPLVMVVDDIHWAEPTLLDLLEHLSEADLAVPALVVCTARHDLLEDRPDWGERPREERIVLAPLADDQAGALVEALLGRSGVPVAVQRRVTTAAEGNPLFVEQLVSMLVDEGTIRRVEGDWRLADEVGEIPVPPTIQALLSARLDRLGRDERSVVEPASVVGLVFPEAAVRWLAPEPVRDGLAGHLSTLDRRQLVHPDPSAAEGEPSYRFHHILIRDAAYNGQLKRTRAALHERFVEWADAVNADRERALEFEEILGYHLEQAHRYLAELGPLDEHGIELGVRAAQRLAAAGRRAFARGDLPATVGLLRRAAAVLPTGTRLRPQLLIEAGEALTEAGELATADEVLEAARGESVALGDATLEATAGLGLLYLHYLTEGDEPEAAVVARVEAAISVLEAAGDERGLSRAWRVLTNVHFAGCRYLDATNAAERMIEHARLAGDRSLELRVLPALATCAQLGPTPVPEAIAIAERVLAELEGDRKSEAYTLRALANLEAMRGRFEEARALYRRSRATLDELGWRFDAALTSAIASGPVELIAEDPAAAEAELRRDYEALAAMGERNYISTTAAFLAEALYRQGRDEEALRMTKESEAIAAADDVATQYLWRSVRAKLVARQGRFAEAEALAAEAIRIIGTAQDPDSQGYAAIDQAEVFRLAGRREDAMRAAEAAAALFDRKANLASAGRARRLRDEIDVGPAVGG
jgi:class 3 adenylate cyclase/tetratricopeptide (TPR) repeat protein